MKTNDLTLHQPNSTDVVITKTGALGRWSHTDQCGFTPVPLHLTYVYVSAMGGGW